MTKTKLLSAALLALATSLAAAPANAHYLWLEQHGAQPRLYFGEINEVREKSPGRLDEIPGPKVWSGEGAARRDYSATRTATHFALAAPGAGKGAAGAPLLASETSIGVKDWTKSGLGIVKPMFYARSAAWPAKAALTPELALDIVPVAGRKNTFQVFFNGAPLAKAKVAIVAPNDWTRDERSDAQGFVTLPTPWRGTYLLEVIHKEAKAGEYEGKPYESLRHRMTLTFTQAGGISTQGTGGGASLQAPAGMAAQ
jgi:hypothetical protein